MSTANITYIPRFSQKGTDRASIVSATEREAGKRANYHVYYKRGDKTFFDPSWATTPQEAVTQMYGFFRELRMKADVIGIVSLVPCEV